jgi:hypothetical protein
METIVAVDALLNFLNQAPLSTEIEFAVEEEDTDGKGTGTDQWAPWSTHSTEEEARAAMAALKPTEGRLRVARVTYETLVYRER